VEEAGVLMNSRKTRSLRAQQKPSPKHGVHSRKLIRVSKEKLESLNTLRFHCNVCKRWLPALAFYAEVKDQGKEASDDAVYLARHEVKVEGLKGQEKVVVCEDCAKDMGQD
jgi:hypothetical protein